MFIKIGEKFGYFDKQAVLWAICYPHKVAILSISAFITYFLAINLELNCF